MTGIYLRCDQCGKTLGGEQVTKNPQGALGWSQEGQLREAAIKLGWTGPLNRGSVFDRCPECSKRKKDEADFTDDTLIPASILGLINTEPGAVFNVVNDPETFKPNGGTFGGGGASESWDSSSNSDSGSSSSSSSD